MSDPDTTDLTTTLHAFRNLNEALAGTPEYHGANAKLVLGKTVRPADAKKLAKQAAELLIESFGIWEIMKLIHDPRFGLETYLKTLADIRDNEGTGAKDRMLAADKIVQTLMGVLRSSMGGSAESALDSPNPPARPSPNLMQVLVNVNEASGTTVTDPLIGPRRDARLVPPVITHTLPMETEPCADRPTLDPGLPTESNLPGLGEKNVLP